MAMTSFNWKCGHTGQTSGGANAVTELEQEYCPGCGQYKQRFSVLPIGPNDLVELEGSEKQIKWAIDLRDKAVKAVHERIERAARTTSTEELERGKQVYIMVINRQPSAKWWIDHRYDGLSVFDQEYVKEYQRGQ